MEMGDLKEMQRREKSRDDAVEGEHHASQEKPAAKVSPDQRTWTSLAVKGRGSEIQRRKHRSVEPGSTGSGASVAGCDLRISTCYSVYTYVIIVFTGPKLPKTGNRKWFSLKAE